MAFLEDFGNAEHIESVMKEMGKDPATGRTVSFGVRPIPDDVAGRIENSYGIVERATLEEVDADGKRRAMASKVRLYRPDEQRSILIDKAIWMWVSSENLSVKLRDQEAVDFYRKQGVVGNVGDEICIDDKLNEAIKRRYLERDITLAAKIFEAANKVEKERATAREASLGNS